MAIDVDGDGDEDLQVVHGKGIAGVGHVHVQRAERAAFAVDQRGTGTMRRRGQALAGIEAIVRADVRREDRLLRFHDAVDDRGADADGPRRFARGSWTTAVVRLPSSFLSTTATSPSAVGKMRSRVSRIDSRTSSRTRIPRRLCVIRSMALSSTRRLATERLAIPSWKTPPRSRRRVFAVHFVVVDRDLRRRRCGQGARYSGSRPLGEADGVETRKSTSLMRIRSPSQNLPPAADRLLVQKRAVGAVQIFQEELVGEAGIWAWCRLASRFRRRCRSRDAAPGPASPCPAVPSSFRYRLANYQQVIGCFHENPDALRTWGERVR